MYIISLLFSETKKKIRNNGDDSVNPYGRESDERPKRWIIVLTDQWAKSDRLCLLTDLGIKHRIYVTSGPGLKAMDNCH
jgi:hypothetical protein